MLNDFGRITASVGHGKAVMKSCSLDFKIYKVTEQWNRAPAVTSGVRRPGLATQKNVGAHGNINGVLYSDSIEFEPGTILLLTASRTVRGSTVSEGAILLRLRPGAAFIGVNAHMPQSVDNYHGPAFNMFTGYADILSVEEAEVLGLRVPRGYVARFFNPDEVAERFDVLEFSPETVARPEFMVISTATGTVVKEVAPTPARRIRIRK